MICFMTYSVYSLNFSNLFPQQSEYLMMITLYFLLSICWTLISMAWFVICNHFITKTEMPKTLYAFCGLLQRIFCCCFPSPKADDETDAIVEDGEFNESVDQDSTKVTSTQNMKFVSGQKISPSRLQTRIALKTINTNNEEATPKCNFCNRCKSCQADFDKDKVKDKNKKDIEARCNALNYLVLLCVSLFMFISNMVVWLLMSR